MESWTSQKVDEFLRGFHYERPKDFQNFDGARLLNAKVATFVRMGYPRDQARILHRAVQDLKVFLNPGPACGWKNDKSTESQISDSGKNCDIERFQSLKGRDTTVMRKSQQKRVTGKKKPLSKVQMLIAKANANPAPAPVIIKNIKKRTGNKGKVISKPVPQENVVALSAVKPSVPKTVCDQKDRERPSIRFISKPEPGEDAVSLSTVIPSAESNLSVPNIFDDMKPLRRQSTASTGSSIKDRISAYRGSFQANEEGHKEKIRAMKSAKREETEEAVKNVDRKGLQEVIGGIIKRKKKGDVPEFLKTAQNHSENSLGNDLTEALLDGKDITARMSKHLEEQEFLAPIITKNGKQSSTKKLTMNNSIMLSSDNTNSGKVVYKSFCDSLLAQKDTLTEVNLNGCALNDEFIEYLCPVLMELQLEVLSLESNDIRKDGVLHLAEVIRRSPKLRVFRMTNQRHPVPTIAYERLFEALKESSSLLTISVDFREQLQKDQVYRITRSNHEKLRIARREKKRN